MTREEFADTWKRKSGLDDEQFEALGFVVVDCECGEGGCQGWAVVHKNQLRERTS